MLEQQVEVLERTAAVQRAAIGRKSETSEAEQRDNSQDQLDRTLDRLSLVRRRLEAFDE
jgi:hypothetical protein